MWRSRNQQSKNKTHYIAVIGGSVSGSEAAAMLADQGVRVVVIDQNTLPYGKLEDGLPKWHHNLRDKQEAEIDKKLDKENIRFVPNMKIGKDFDFKDLVDLGFTAVLLANGAWKDRPLPVDGINRFKDKQLIYQNDLLKWYNHYHEPDYKGMSYDIQDGVVVVGGGLASLDVIKIVMMELVEKKLKELLGKDIIIDQFEMEKKGLDKYLQQFDLKYEDLGLKGATLVYRRKAKHMPLKQPQGGTQEAKEKAQIVSQRILDNYRKKFHFDFIPEATPVGFIEENGEFKGLVLQKYHTDENNKLYYIAGETFPVYTGQVISSIGSIPEPIPGIPYEGDRLKTTDGNDSQIYGFDNVFAIGNAVTGKGNIKTAKDHGSLVTKNLLDNYLQKNTQAFDMEIEAYNEEVRKKTDEKISNIFSGLLNQAPPDDITVDHIWEITKQYQDKVGYKDYRSWIEKHKPVRYEEIIREKKKQVD
jgi:NADPH-dependent glutamate synthase beta subunit-like oxidoreductase